MSAAKGDGTAKGGRSTAQGDGSTAQGGLSVAQGGRSAAADASDAPARTPLVAGNWKMHKIEAEAESYIQALLPRLSSIEHSDVGLCVPFTDLRAMVDSTRGSRVEIYAQNMHEQREGAFTGEISAAMLNDIDARGVVLGHSERRELFGETDKALSAKVPAALAAGLTPILCVGETEEERDSGDTERKLRHQVREDLAAVPAAELPRIVIAYEPIWAIGTGRVATPEQAQEAIAFIRALLSDSSVAPGGDPQAAAQIRILYGGSVKPENAGELLTLPDVDGALVGGASLDPEAFAAIVTAAETAQAAEQAQ